MRLLDFQALKIKDRAWKFFQCIKTNIKILQIDPDNPEILLILIYI